MVDLPCPENKGCARPEVGAKAPAWGAGRALPDLSVGRGLGERGHPK